MMGYISATKYIYNEADLSNTLLPSEYRITRYLSPQLRKIVMDTLTPHSLTSFGIFLMLYHLISQSLLTSSISRGFEFTHACRTPRSPKTSSAPPRIASNF
jgi:hypothetical protein